MSRSREDLCMDSTTLRCPSCGADVDRAIGVGEHQRFACPVRLELLDPRPPTVAPRSGRPSNLERTAQGAAPTAQQTRAPRPRTKKVRTQAVNFQAPGSVAARYLRLEEAFKSTADRATRETIRMAARNILRDFGRQSGERVAVEALLQRVDGWGN